MACVNLVGNYGPRLPIMPLVRSIALKAQKNEVGRILTLRCQFGNLSFS
jgi:hypothetical protein